MLQNARVTAFTVSELLRLHQQGGGLPLPAYIRIKIEFSSKPSLSKCKRIAILVSLGKTSLNMVLLVTNERGFAKVSAANSMTNFCD